MHHVIRSVRRIAAEDLPTVADDENVGVRAADDEELLTFGLARIAGDLFSVSEQYHSTIMRDPLTGEPLRIWHPPGETADVRGPRTAEHAARRYGIGEILSVDDDARRRFLRLPNAIRRDVVLADVVDRAPVETALAEQQAAIDRYVGDVDGAPLVDLVTDEARADAGRRLAELSDSDIAPTRVRMADIDEAVHVIIAANVPPHAWAGESV
jgi:hypothetical protein